MRLLHVPVLLLLIGAAAPLAAQRPQPADTTPVPLEPVTVTVLRAPFELREVPFAVSVNGPTEIQRAKPGLGLDEALHAIPGVQVDNRYNYALGERISIRGQGARAQFGVRGAKVLLDGIPATMPDGQTTLNHVDLGFVRRAEVIRGPASSLYGNAAGGVIQLETELPPPVPLAQEIGMIAGGDGLLRLHSTTGGRSGGAEYVLNVARLAYDGYRDFSAAENTLLNARLGYQGERDRVHLIVAAVDYQAQNPGSLSEALLAADRTQAFANNLRQRTGEEGRHGQVGALWRRDLPAGELELSGYLLSRALDNPIPPRIIDLERAAGGARALLRSRTRLAARELQWTIGAEADLQRDDRLNFANEEGTRGSLLLDQLERVDGLGAFAQAAAELTRSLQLLAGVRYDRLRFEVDDQLVTGANPDDSGERIMDALSPSVGLSYSPAPGLNLYANVATSFETPTTTELANRATGAGGFNPELDPQRSLSYEAGAKGRIDSRVAYQLAAYRSDVRDALIPFEVPDVPGRQFFRNAGSAAYQGVEAGLTLALTPALRARAAYTYTDARFGDYVVDGTPFDDNRVPGVAPHRLEGSLGYEPAAGWFAELEGRYVDALPTNDANTVFAPGYALFSARAGLERLRLGDVALEPFVGVTNLLDREYNTSVVINAFGGRFFEPGPGRSLYLGANLALGTR